MATSGTYSFTLPVDELIDQAIPLAGGEPTKGQDVRYARRALQLLFIDLQNRGVRLHSVDRYDVTISTTATSLSPRIQDILDATVQTSGGSDLDVKRISFSDYIDIPRKGQSGRPTHFYVDRKINAPILYVWPVPTTATTFSFYGVTKSQDVGALSNDIDFHQRYFPALVMGLAYQIALSRGARVPLERLQWLKSEFEQLLDAASGEDRERVTLRIRPSYRRP
jgi:hypothetical protein